MMIIGFFFECQKNSYVDIVHELPQDMIDGAPLQINIDATPVMLDIDEGKLNRIPPSPHYLMLKRYAT